MNTDGIFLDIILSDDLGKHFFMDAFSRLGESGVSSKLNVSEFKSSPRHLRAICIFLILAKHRSEKWDEEWSIEFKAVIRREPGSNVPLCRRNWIYTLAGQKRDLSDLKARNNPLNFFPPRIRFYDAQKGAPPEKTANHWDKTTIILASSTLLASGISLTRINFFKNISRTGKIEKVQLDGLSRLALDLEKFENTQPRNWGIIVPDIVKETENSPFAKAHKKATRREPNKIDIPSTQNDKDKKSNFTPMPKNVWVAESWRDFAKGKGDAGERAQQRIEKPNPKETWYFISVTPDGFDRWKDDISEAVGKNGVNVKWVFHSAEEGKKCKKLRAQWIMTYPYGSSDVEKVNHVLNSLDDELNSLKKMADDARAIAAKSRTKCGTFEFFQSTIVHFFMGFMAVPKAEHFINEDGKAPKGTVCMIQPYALYPVHLASRWVLYLESQSSILDIYYNSFMEFFKNGKDSEYLERLDSTTLVPVSDKK